MTSHVAYSVETLREAAEYYTPASEVNPLLEWAADEIERLGTRISDCLSEQAEKNAMLNQAQEHAIDCGRITLEVQDRLYLLTNVEQYAGLSREALEQIQRRAFSDAPAEELEDAQADLRAIFKLATDALAKNPNPSGHHDSRGLAFQSGEPSGPVGLGPDNDLTARCPDCGVADGESHRSECSKAWA